MVNGQDVEENESRRLVRYAPWACTSLRLTMGKVPGLYGMEE